MPSVQRVAWAKFRTAAVCAVAVLILLTLFFLNTGGTMWSQKADIYLYMPDAEGLERDSPVRVDGLDIGKVKFVRLTESKDPKRAVRATIEVEKSRLSRVWDGSVAEISSDSLIGDKFVDISSNPSGNTLKPGGEIKLKESADIMKAIDIRDLEKQLVMFDSVLSDLESGRGPVGQFFHGRQIYDDVVKKCAEIERAFKAAIDSTTQMGSILYKDELYRDLADTVASFDAAVAKLQSGQGAAGQFLRDPAQYEELRNSLATMRKSVAEMHANSLLQSNEILPGLDKALLDLIQRVDEINVNPLLHTTDTYESLAGMALEFQKTMHDFRTHPEKFLRIKLF